MAHSLPRVYIACVLLKVFFSLGLAAILAACSSQGTAAQDPTFPEQPVTTLPSTSGNFAVAVRTWPAQHPTLGDSSFELDVRDSQTGDPVPGLDVAVVPFMPAMGHGTSIVPTVTEPSPGVYRLDHVVLFMPGTWQIRTTLNGPMNDAVVPTFDIR